MHLIEAINGVYLYWYPSNSYAVFKSNAELELKCVINGKIGDVIPVYRRLTGLSP